jgi:hypothetical protein
MLGAGIAITGDEEHSTEFAGHAQVYAKLNGI